MGARKRMHTIVSDGEGSSNAVRTIDDASQISRRAPIQGIVDAVRAIDRFNQGLAQAVVKLPGTFEDVIERGSELDRLLTGVGAVDVRIETQRISKVTPLSEDALYVELPSHS
jgi:hypothetical protein